MEENLAILIADLSGYTALTETHGSSTAADMIDKYIEIVKESLVGDSELHQSVGDEVLVVSASPDHIDKYCNNAYEKMFGRTQLSTGTRGIALWKNSKT